MEVPLRAVKYAERCAVRSGGRAWRYADLLAASVSVARRLPPCQTDAWPIAPGLGAREAPASAGTHYRVPSGSRPWFLDHHSKPLRRGKRVALLSDPGPALTAAAWGTWLRGGILVPLALSHPRAELDYVMQDSQVSVVAADEPHTERAASLARDFGAELLVVEDPPVAADAADAMRGLGARDAWGVFEAETMGLLSTEDVGALIIYTSGTTGRPKGVLHTHASLAAQMASLCQAWEWSEKDAILHMLPMHHIHGIVNAWLCAHNAGATVEFMDKFVPSDVWGRLREGSLTTLMGVPTMYALLLSHLDGLPEADRRACEEAARGLRLAVSGSAACPVPVMERWKAATGTYLLERYGMTEIGMALSNPLRGERRPGSVGTPLPYCEAKLDMAAARGGDGVAGSQAAALSMSGSSRPDGRAAGAVAGESGAAGGDRGVKSSRAAEASRLVASPSGVDSDDGAELLIRGPCLFREYWGKRQATDEAFCASEDGDPWFRTGDTAALRGDPERYVILGRTSVDVLKSRGYKLSALSIESAVLRHPAVAEAAVVGLADEVLGQKVAAVVALHDGRSLTIHELRKFLKDELAPYALPEKLFVVPRIPRNAMGKVNKKDLVRTLVESRN